MSARVAVIIAVSVLFCGVGRAQEQEASAENPVPVEIRYQDRPEWQMVAIEALVVEITEESSRDLGLTFGISTLESDGSDSSGIVDGVNIGLGAQNLSPVSVAQLAESGDGSTSLSFADRMPGFGISLAGIDIGSAALAAELRALLDRGEAVIRTRPIAVALNKTEVKIETADEIPYVDVNIKGNLGIQKKKVGVQLQVTPSILTENPGFVKLDISRIEISSGLTFITLQNVNRPVVSVSRTQTSVTLREGETFVVGGLKTRRTVIEKEGIPVLRSIPVLRWIFSSRHEVERNMDVFFFITPKILDPGENFLLPYDFQNREFLGGAVDN